MRWNLNNLLFFAAATIAQPSRAQSDGSTTPPAATTADGIDQNPILSPRAEGMGGAVTSLADDKDAAFNNPAGIGGTHVDKKNNNWVRKLYFPFISVAANKSSRALYNDMRSSGGITDSAVGEAVVDAKAGERQYARANTGLGLVIGRVMVLPFSDLQLSATPRGEGSNMIDVREVSTTGLGLGFSVTDNQERFALGYFGYGASRSDLSGTFDYQDLSDADRRKAAVAANTEKYSALGHNVGINWRMGKTAMPTIGLSMRDVGNTKFKGKGGGAADVVVKQDLSAGFSASPMVGKIGTLNFSTGAERLLDSDVSFVKKYRVGLELTMGGGSGSYARCAVRGGYTDAGGSGGVSLNLGLLGVEAGVNSVDIGLGNEKVIEHRYVGTIYVNVADF